MDWIQEEAERRELKHSDVLREVIATGVSVLRSGE
jgi:hypothetical protein